jgi:hypothetical protein
MRVYVKDLFLRKGNYCERKLGERGRGRESGYPSRRPGD